MKKPRRPPSTIHTKILQSVIAASVGAAAGYAYAKLGMPRPLADRSGAFTGMYATAGAVLGVVSMRLGAIVRSLLEDYGPRDR